MWSKFKSKLEDFWYDVIDTFYMMIDCVLDNIWALKRRIWSVVLLLRVNHPDFPAYGEVRGVLFGKWVFSISEVRLEVERGRVLFPEGFVEENDIHFIRAEFGFNPAEIEQDKEAE